eukprot:CAMPEP_0202486124 /NCGR_PEP_ID=MMETSP1361-20130828/4775_1 /ASSEMBLY_ACC=CAM_ASM_000849 /TAXON_ID=210615 /ORGANISM="Staurosira complex sp., Strain CCMP2646" /LENGTH=436 /DNA_ID=CAMNT_0049115181 /DNA_START=182 /DNA_END=1492 /DNA_ORIENTATION=-
MALFSVIPPMAAICVLVSPFLIIAYYTIAAILIQLFRDYIWHFYNDEKRKGTKGNVIGQGEVRYADKSLVIGDVYPDDFDVTLPNPNTHKTSVPQSVVLHEPTGKEDLMINGLTYADLSNLNLSPILSRVQSNGGTFDEDTHDAMQKALKYHTIHLSSKGSSLVLLWVPKYGINAWSVPPMGNNYPHSHCDADLRGEPMYSMTRGLSPWLFHRLSFLQLVNIWFPVQSLPCKPLVVCDTTTLDKNDVFKHKLYNKKGTVDAFTHTFNPSQRWVVPAEWHPPMAVVFRTSWTPHTSSPLPGENLTSPLFEEIKRIRDFIEKAVNERSDLDPCGELQVDKGALEELDGDKELEIAKVPAVAKSLQELRATLRELPRRCQEAKGDPEKLQTLVKELDLILGRSVAMRVAVRAVVLRWDLTIVSVSVAAFLGTFWMFGWI